MDYVDNILSRWEQVRVNYIRLKDSLEETIQERDQIEKQHQQVLESVERLAKAMEYTKTIMTLVTKKDIQPLEELLTRGLQTIFHSGYSVTIEIDDRGKDKTAEFMVHEINPETRVKESTEARETGFGIQTALSLILQVFFLMYEGGQKFLIWDEPLSQVDEAHMDNMFAFIKELILEEGIDILGVTHDPRLWEFANKTYVMKNGKLTIEAETK